MSDSLLSSNYRRSWADQGWKVETEMEKLLLLPSYPIFVVSSPCPPPSSVPPTYYRLEKNEIEKMLSSFDSIPISQHTRLVFVRLYHSSLIKPVSTLMLFGLLIFLLCVECSFVGCFGSQNTHECDKKKTEIEVEKTFFYILSRKLCAGGKKMENSSRKSFSSSSSAYTYVRSNATMFGKSLLPFLCSVRRFFSPQNFSLDFRLVRCSFCCLPFSFCSEHLQW